MEVSGSCCVLEMLVTCTVACRDYSVAYGLRRGARGIAVRLGHRGPAARRTSELHARRPHGHVSGISWQQRMAYGHAYIEGGGHSFAAPPTNTVPYRTAVSTVSTPCPCDFPSLSSTPHTVHLSALTARSCYCRPLLFPSSPAAARRSRRTRDNTPCFLHPSITSISTPYTTFSADPSSISLPSYPHNPLPRCREALQAYQEALTYAPNNVIARQRSDFCKEKVARFSSV